MQRRSFDLLEARNLLLEGLSYREIGDKLGVSGAAICKCIHRYYPALKRKPGRPKRGGKIKISAPITTLPIARSDFLKPITKKQLMAGR